VLGLCGSFAVVPVLGLIHIQTPTTSAAQAKAAAGAAVPAADVRLFADRASRSDFRVDQPDQGLDSQVSAVPAVLATPDTTADPPISSAPPTTRAAVVRPRRIITTTTVPRPRPTPTTTAPPPAHSETGGASWYEAPDGTCANNDAPMGTVVTVTDVSTGRSVTCQVTSRGPFASGRIIDLAETTFSRLAPAATGVIQVRVTW
jgi:rare lipoprotein A (RlpA)-like double-psi beta-barrel protein